MIMIGKDYEVIIAMNVIDSVIIVGSNNLILTLSDDWNTTTRIILISSKSVSNRLIGITTTFWFWFDQLTVSYSLISLNSAPPLLKWFVGVLFGSSLLKWLNNLNKWFVINMIQHSLRVVLNKLIMVKLLSYKDCEADGQSVSPSLKHFTSLPTWHM